ncbi:Random slug protein [Actinidia chinensis var. chinensis]|uniref:Random slug protein n=1 Tax=Actinidia chinensis var. chinensis TaxID=1590841 RepID=A0A2R6QYE3_ACTCC|nr:Random slug protein [Actinidia chinensis var. chinensis]
MSEDSKKSTSNGWDKEQMDKIDELRRLLGPLREKLSIYCSDASIARYLRARNWNVKKATKMLKDTLKWRLEYKPEEIRWDEVAREAETGKIYRSNYADKHGRTVLVMRPRCQNTKSTKSQMRYLVYCMENAIMNLPQSKEEMVWLIDFNGYNLSNFSVKLTRETAHVLQEHYPERLGIAILYNPPTFFEPFWTLVKPFLEPKTANKVKFVYADDPNTMKIMEDLFDLDQIESAFGGKDNEGFDVNKYAERMREDDKRMPSFWARGHASYGEAAHQPLLPTGFSFNPTKSKLDSDVSDEKSGQVFISRG